jgi:hypothetical protein
MRKPSFPKNDTFSWKEERRKKKEERRKKKEEEEARSPLTRSSNSY